MTLALLLSNALAVPAIADPVTDLAHVIAAEDEARLDSRIRDIRAKTGVQTAVLTVSSCDGLTIEEFAFEAAQTWEGGGARDDGILVVLSIGERRSRIEVGYGLEGYLTDGEAGALLEDAVPLLESRDYGGAVGQILDGIGHEVDSLTPEGGIPTWSRAFGLGVRWFPTGWPISLAGLLYGGFGVLAVVWARRRPGFPVRVRNHLQGRFWPLMGAWLVGWALLWAVVKLLGKTEDPYFFLLWGAVGIIVQLPVGFASKPREQRWGLYTAAVLFAILVGVGAMTLSASPGIEANILGLFYLVVGFAMTFGASSEPGSGGGGGGGGHTSQSSSSSSYDSSSSGSSSGGGDWGGGGGGFGGGGASGSW